VLILAYKYVAFFDVEMGHATRMHLLDGNQNLLEDGESGDLTEDLCVLVELLQAPILRIFEDHKFVFVVNWLIDVVGVDRQILEGEGLDDAV